MKQACVIALGFFDGVHRGHGALLEVCRGEASRLGVRAVAVTFDRHPSALLTGTEIPLLSTFRQRQRIMEEKYGIDCLVELPFDEAMGNMPWEDFLKNVLIDTMGAVSLVCGEDYRFGKGGKGNAILLKEACNELGLDCHVIPPFCLGGKVVSSTRIRELIGAGKMEEAAELLGYPYSLTGRVISGRGLGRTLGTPTANLACENDLLPPYGVYAAKAVTKDGSWLAVVNIGVRPTVEGHHVTVEPWLLDFSGDLYGEEIYLELHKFLRPERKFPDLQALREEIFRNGEQTKVYFRERQRSI